MARPGYALGMVRPTSLVVSILAGQALATFVAHTLKLRMPQRGAVIGATLNVGLRGGTHVTSTLDIKSGATSLLASLFDIAALTPGTPVDKEGATLAAAAADVAKDAVLSFVTAEAGGTTPTWSDVTIQLDYTPLGE